MAEKEGNWFKRHKILTVIIALVIVGIIASASGGSNSSTSNQSDDKQQSSETSSNSGKATLAKLGEPARDGKFEFTLKSIKCGKSRVGDQ